MGILFPTTLIASAAIAAAVGGLTSHLWQPLRAYLYTCVVELWQHGQCIDTNEQPFGVRTVEVKEQS